MIEIVVKPEEVTTQSLRSLESWYDSRGDGEPLKQAVIIMTSAFRAGLTVTISTD